MSTEIYGTDHETIQILGQGELTQEFTPSCDDPCFLAFSDGTVLRCDRTPEDEWVMTVEREGSNTVGHIWEKNPDSDNYRSRVVMSGRVFWVVGGDFMGTED
jgi:hypothetical protein